MNAGLKFFTFTFYCVILSVCSYAQTDSLFIRTDSLLKEKKKKSAKQKELANYNPRKAPIRSAIIPGWGQVTNRKYWKLPLVYGALGTTAYLFMRNLTQYTDAKNAYILATDNNPLNDNQIKQPYFSVKDQPERIRTFRNEVRQNVDYCVLFFIAFWGLNIADAAVDAHLKTFDVSDDLTIRLKAGFSPIARTNGVSIIVPLGK